MMLIMQINEDHEVTLRREGTLGFLSGILIVAAAEKIRVFGAIRRRDRAQVHKEGVSLDHGQLHSVSSTWARNAYIRGRAERHKTVRFRRIQLSMS